MYFSAFAPLGLLRFRGQVSDAEAIYTSLAEGLGGAFDLSDGTHMQGSLVARSIALASVQAAQESVANALLPASTNFNLPNLESDWGVITSPTDTTATQIANVDVAQQVSHGAGRPALEAALSALLGADFIATRLISELVDSVTLLHLVPAVFPPSTPFVGPGLFDDKTSVPTRFLLRDPVAVLGAPFTVHYSSLAQYETGYLGLDGEDPVFLTPGVSPVVQMENLGYAEKVTITDVSVNDFSLAQNGLFYPTFTAIFTRPHEAGNTICLGYRPIWVSDRRHILVIVSAAAATNLDTRRRIHRLMAVMTRAVTTWDIVQPSGMNTLGPFTLDQSPLDSVPLGNGNSPPDGGYVSILNF